MRARRHLQLLCLVFAQLAAAYGCASRLKHTSTAHAPHGQGEGDVEEALDLSSVTFFDARSDAQVAVSDYMVANARDYLLLTFGSKGCAACNRKAEHLTNEVIGRHPLYLTDEGRRFEIVGINTDTEPYRRLAGYLEHFPFIKWKDPAGREMLKDFMPSGHAFSVPLTVMVSKHGIAWKVLPEETLSMDELIAKVEHTLGLTDASDGSASGNGGEGSGSGDGDSGSGGAGPGGEGGGSGDGGADGGPVAALASEASGRLKSVAVTSCDGQKAATVDEALGAGSLRFVSVSKGACDADCLANVEAMNRAVESCRMSGRTCARIALAAEAPSADACATGAVWRGGAEFYDVFKTHFDWAHTPLEGPPPLYELSLPPLAGPLTFGFDQNGRLVFSKEGRLASDELKDLLAAPSLGELARGPDFPLYDNTRGHFLFADWRRESRFTVVSAWGAYPAQCDSCIKELQHWSAPGQLFDFCAARPSDCQVAALEVHLPERAGTTLAQFFDGIVNGDGAGFDGLVPQGIRVPLLLDPQPQNGPQGTEYLKRFFDGYMLALRPDWGVEFRTLVYDREGKVVQAFKVAEPGGEDPVLRYVRSQLSQ